MDETALAVEMRGIVAQRQQPAVTVRVQRFHAAIHHLGETGDVGYIDNLETSLAQGLCRAAGRDEFDTVTGSVPPSGSRMGSLATAARTRSARPTASSTVVDGNRMTNSSPP